MEKIIRLAHKIIERVIFVYYVIIHEKVFFDFKNIEKLVDTTFRGLSRYLQNLMADFSLDFLILYPYYFKRTCAFSLRKGMFYKNKNYSDKAHSSRI